MRNFCTASRHSRYCSFISQPREVGTKPGSLASTMPGQLFESIGHVRSGQKAKYSLRADVFRCSPNIRHSARASGRTFTLTMPACVLVSAIGRQRGPVWRSEGRGRLSHSRSPRPLCRPKSNRRPPPRASPIGQIFLLRGFRALRQLRGGIISSDLSVLKARELYDRHNVLLWFTAEWVLDWS
jgi:hypothetical protein